MRGSDFTHLDAAGRARMVDVGGKPETQRTATARCRVIMQPETLRLIRTGGVKKGDVLAEFDCGIDIARLREIQAKQRLSQKQLDAY